MVIGIGSDHGGYELKEFLKDFLQNNNYKVKDFGCFSTDSVDYPDIAIPLCKELQKGEIERGILICGTGIGMSITANRFKGIRATLCNDLFSAKMSRRHNNSNLLCMGGRIVGKDLAREILLVWLNEPFDGDRHIRRLKKIDDNLGE